MTPFWKTLVLLILGMQIFNIFGIPGETATQAQEQAPVRAYPISSLETDSTVDPLGMHIVVGENAMTSSEFFRYLTRGNGSTENGLNMAIADFAYIATERKTLLRSGFVREVDDSPDWTLGRAPGKYPNNPDYNNLLNPWTIMGNIGFSAWTGSRGFGSFVAGMQGSVAPDRRHALLLLGTATGKIGWTPDRSKRYDADEFVPHVALWPSGTIEMGYGTDPAQRPRWTNKVHGNMLVSGAVYAQRCIELPASTIEAEMKQLP